MHAKTGVFKVTLLLALCRLIIAGPMHNATRPANNSEEFSGNGTTEEEETNNNEEETTFQRARPIRQVHFNEYLLEAYKVADLAKRTNCTEDLQILNQTVSEHFCTSNKTVYSLLNGRHNVICNNNNSPMGNVFVTQTPSRLTGAAGDGDGVG